MNTQENTMIQEEKMDNVQEQDVGNIIQGNLTPPPMPKGFDLYMAGFGTHLLELISTMSEVIAHHVEKSNLPALAIPCINNTLPDDEVKFFALASPYTLENGSYNVLTIRYEEVGEKDEEGNKLGNYILESIILGKDDLDHTSDEAFEKSFIESMADYATGNFETYEYIYSEFNVSNQYMGYLLNGTPKAVIVDNIIKAFVRNSFEQMFESPMLSNTFEAILVDRFFFGPTRQPNLATITFTDAVLLHVKREERKQMQGSIGPLSFPQVLSVRPGSVLMFNKGERIDWITVTDFGLDYVGMEFEYGKEGEITPKPIHYFGSNEPETKESCGNCEHCECEHKHE